MKSFKSIIILVTVMLLMGCAGTQSPEVVAQQEQQFKALQDLVNTKAFQFNAERAYPLESAAVMKVTNVLLQNTGNVARRIILDGDYIKINNETAEGDLAFLGEARVVHSLDANDNGINFNNATKDFKITENAENKSIAITFDVKGKRELYTVYMTLFLSKRASVTISSSNRTSMKYDGKITSI